MKKMFLSFTDKIKTNFRQELAARINNKQRFSISLDEWTSIKNQRYVGLNLHLNDATLQSLGMLRIKAGDVDDGEELKLQGEKLKRAKNFKYLGSTVSSNGRCEEEVRRKIQAGRMSW